MTPNSFLDVLLFMIQLSIFAEVSFLGVNKRLDLLAFALKYFKNQPKTVDALVSISLKTVSILVRWGKDWCHQHR